MKLGANLTAVHFRAIGRPRRSGNKGGCNGQIIVHIWNPGEGNGGRIEGGRVRFNTVKLEVAGRACGGTGLCHL